MITDQQRARRLHKVGSSDMAAILGMSPWATAEDIRLAKSGLVEDGTGNDATRAGIWLEPAVLNWAEDELGEALARDWMVEHPNGVMAANCDGILLGKIPVEAKTSGIVGPVTGNWGASGTAEIPEMYLVQVHHQMACLAAERGYVAALIGGRGFVLYRIERDDKLVSLIESQAVLFWNEYVVKGRRAPNSLASTDVLRRVRRVSGEVANVQADIVDDYIAKRRARLDAERTEEEAQRRMLTLAGTADAIRRGMDGDVVVTLKQDKRGRRSLRVKQEEQ